MQESQVILENLRKSIELGCEMSQTQSDPTMLLKIIEGINQTSANYLNRFANDQKTSSKTENRGRIKANLNLKNIEGTQKILNYQELLKIKKEIGEIKDSIRNIHQSKTNTSHRKYPQKRN